MQVTCTYPTSIRLPSRQAIDEYLDAYYGEELFGERETVSMHLRLGYADEPAKDLLESR